MDRFLRILLIIVGFLSLLLAVGFCLRLSYLISFWPWADSPLPYTFLGSITAAAALSLLWIGFSGELGTVVGGGIHLTVFYSGLTLSLLLLSQQRRDPRFVAGALFCLGGALISLSILLWFRRYPLLSYRPIPLLVRISFGIFIMVLASVGSAALLHIPNVFAWKLSQTSAALIGSFFLGAACYFIYGLLRPSWHNACGQLWAFLAYDIVLIGPFLHRFTSVSPERLPSLIVNTFVLLYSGGLAVYYLLLNKETRVWGAAQERPSQVYESHQTR